MNNPNAQGSLEVHVTDFGPIKEARVDMRPLTVFLGPSNTGKSYLAILIYALHQFFQRTQPFGFDPNARSLSTHHSPKELIRVLKALEESLASDAPSVCLPPIVTEFFQSEFDRTAHNLAWEVARCFGISDLTNVTRQGAEAAATLEIRRRLSGQQDLLSHEATFVPQPQLRISLPAEIPISIPKRRVLWSRLHTFLQSPLPTDQPNYILGPWPLLNMIALSISDTVVGPFRSPAFYLPADRTGIMHAHTTVVSALIANAPQTGLRPVTGTPTLTGVLADFLQSLIDIDRTVHSPQEPSPDLARNIEGLLGGTIFIDRSPYISYPIFAYRPDGWETDLPLANASSMVSDLAPVVLYLRHLITPDNVLIIEEPESHLHPAVQVEFTRQIASIVNAGVRVIVTTHSEWILEELTNLVHRSLIPKQKRRKNGSDDVSLSKDQVGVWLFEPTSVTRCSVVKEVCLSVPGIYYGYDDVANALHNDWADITSRIEDKR